ncbi:MAG: serine protease [Erythrobacter sp.]
MPRISALRIPMLAVNVDEGVESIFMDRFICIFAALFALILASTPASADQGDIDAAARGVVRVVLIGSDGEEVYPISHGSGFAVTPRKIVTNAHVVREALQDDTLRIGIVPSQGDEAAYGKAISVSPKNDLALIEITEGSLRLPVLTMAGSMAGDMGEVSSVGYPMNVDRAQGLEIGDIFKAQPPVKARGFLSGQRPSRQFDTILHTAPIARGNSGGPLLDGCGRVLGVNSFGADSDGSDAEFYFAVSMRELLPFLRDNDVEPRVNALACRSIADLNASEAARLEEQREEARERLEARDAELAGKRSRAQFEAQIAVFAERENAMAMAMIALLIAIGAGYFALQARYEEDGEKRTYGFAALAIAAIIGAAYLWMTRPGLEDIDRRVDLAMNDAGGDAGGGGENASTEGTLICALASERSRITGARSDDVEFKWEGDGCVNSRTQYGFKDDEWTRVFVPDTEDAVSVNSYDPDTRTFRTDRYLLGANDMEKARAARGKYTPPQCGVSDASRTLGEQQGGVLGLLPTQPNERLVYECKSKAE